MFQQPRPVAPAPDRPFSASEFEARLRSFPVVRDKTARPPVPVYAEAARTEERPSQVVAAKAIVASSSAPVSVSAAPVVETRVDRLRAFLLTQLDGDAALVARVTDAFLSAE